LPTQKGEIAIGKAPAFQLYASDFYMDTAGWTVAQVGAYTRLLMYEWVNGPIPCDMASLARIAGISDARTMYKMWSGTMGKKFISNGGNLLFNKRLEEEREKQAKRKEIQTEKGKHGAEKRWKDHIAPAIAQAQPNDSSSSSSSSSKDIKKKNILSDDEFLKSLKEKFTWVDFEKEMVKIDAWFLANPGRQKTRRFIVKWISKVEKPMGRITTPIHKEDRDPIPELRDAINKGFSIYGENK